MYTTCIRSYMYVYILYEEKRYIHIYIYTISICPHPSVYMLQVEVLESRGRLLRIKFSTSSNLG